MATTRTYGEQCAIAHALDLVGERWSLLVVRELLLGPKRFSDLRAGMPHASPTVLAQRLRELERAGVVRRRKLGPPARAWVYELTEWGVELEGVLMSLGRWGARSPTRPPDGHTGTDAAMLALRTVFDAEAADGLKAVYELRLGVDRFRVEIADGQIRVARGTSHPVDAVIESDPGQFAAVVFGHRPLSEAVDSGDMRIEGSRPLVERFVTLFPRSEPVQVAATPA